jgi:hypothetical protein
MNNEKMNQIIDEAYENYRKTILTEFFENTKELRKWATVEGPGGYNKEEFIDKCKTDKEFSETWGLKIEERELSKSELNILYNIRRGVGKVDTNYSIGTVKSKDPSIPTKLITITYNNETIESYE